MQDPMQPILPMTRLIDLQVNVARTGLSIGDTAAAFVDDAGRVGIAAPVQRYLLGLIPRRPLRLLGYLTPAAADLVAPAMRAGEPFRIRIVGLTPEHLGPEPQVDVSIWGDPRRLLVPQPLTTV